MAAVIEQIPFFSDMKTSAKRRWKEISTRLIFEDIQQ
jgi:hypothetical protein